MARTIVKEIYTISELSEQARQEAKYNWSGYSDYLWADENRKTLSRFENIFPIKIARWEYNQYRGYVSYDITCEDEIVELSGIRLLRYLYNNYEHDLFKGKYYSKGKYINGKYINKHRHSKIQKENCCVLTGYYMDNEILEPIYKFLKNPDKYTTFKDLMQECIDSWVDACVNDYKHCDSMEYFIDECEANEYEFYANGSRY